MQTAVADLSHNENISRQIARSSAFFQNSLRMCEQSRRGRAQRTKFFTLRLNKASTGKSRDRYMTKPTLLHLRLPISLLLKD